MKKLTNDVVFGVEEKLKAQAGEATNKDVWKHLQPLAPPNCPCMQGDKDALNFSYLLKKNKKLKKSKFSRRKTTKAGIVNLFSLKRQRSKKILMANLLLKNQNKIPALPNQFQL